LQVTGAGGVLAGERKRRELPARLKEAQRRCQEAEEQYQAEAEQIAALEAELEELARRAMEAREEAAQMERETVGPARTEVAVAEERWGRPAPRLQWRKRPYAVRKSPCNGRPRC